jgi:hypothetical protein
MIELTSPSINRNRGGFASRSKSPQPSLEGSVIRSLDDAIDVAYAMKDEHGRALASATVDDQGEVRGLKVFSRQCTIKCAIRWLERQASTDSTTKRAFLFSSTTRCVAEISEADLDGYRDAVRKLALHSLEVVDWIQYDGRHVRSLSRTLGIDPW